MERLIVQDGITYKIENDILKSWIGTSPFQRPILNMTFDAIIEGWTQEDEENQLSEGKDTKLKEMHILANIELSEINGLITDNDVLITVGRNEKPIPQNAKNYASSILDQQETIEEEIQSLTTHQEVLDYIIIFE